MGFSTTQYNPRYYVPILDICFGTMNTMPFIVVLLVAGLTTSGRRMAFLRNSLRYTNEPPFDKQHHEKIYLVLMQQARRNRTPAANYHYRCY